MTSPLSFSRYAIYYTPPAKDYLTRFAATWFGWDAYLGVTVAHPVFCNLTCDIKEITSTPSKYGLHGTLKPPFSLAPNRSVDELCSSIFKIAKSVKKFEIPSIDLTILGGFIAIVPTVKSNTMHSLAKKCVKDLDGFRVTESIENLKKRRAVGLTSSEENNLLKWGYPYVLDDFRFHLTLTSKLLPDVSSNVFSVLSSELQTVLTAPLLIGKISLVGEHNMHGKFEVIEEFSLAD